MTRRRTRGHSLARGSKVSVSQLRPKLQANEDEDDSLSSPIRFGDLIALFDNDHRGFVTSSISTSTDAIVSVPEERHLSDRKDPNLGNVKNAVFMIVPQLKYRAEKSLRSEMNRARKPHQLSITYEEALKQAENASKLEQLKELSESELDDNRREIDRRTGDEVLYGHNVLLFHIPSRKYLRVLPTVTSRVEASNVRIDLCSYPSKNTWFRINPRFKVRASGDSVRFSDQVVFESHVAGQYLHSSLALLGDDEMCTGNHEVNVSVSPTTYTVYEYANASNKVQDDGTTTNLHGGEVIQLVHKEIGAYLSAEGNYLAPPVEDVHLRPRVPKPEKRKSYLKATTAVTFWQIEIANAGLKGTTIQWGQDIRIKHIPTQRYLSFQSSGDRGLVSSATLTENKDDPACIFSFHPVTRRSDTVLLDSYARILHVASGNWLTSVSSVPYVRNGRSITHPTSASRALIASTTSIKWDGPRLTTLGLSEIRRFDDAFILQPVSLEQVINAAFVQGMIPVLKHFADSRHKGHASPSLALATQKALKELNDFMFVQGAYVRARQKLLRSMGVIQVIFEVLQSPFKPYNSGPSASTVRDFASAPDFQHTKRVLNAAYVVLQNFLLGESRKNELYLAAYIPFLHSQLPGHVNVADMYTELVMDNHVLVNTMSEKEVSDFVTVLRQRKHHSYLKFLRVLCVCNGAAIQEFQNLVCKKILEDAHDCVYLTDVAEKGSKKSVVVRTSVDAKPVSLVSFTKHRTTGDDEEDDLEYRFLEEQLNLFAALSFSRNEYCSKIIIEDKKYLTWEECFLCLTNGDLPKALRASYVYLLINLFVDVGANTDDLHSINLAYSWDDLRKNPYDKVAHDRTLSITGASLEYFPEIADWLSAYIETRRDIIASDTDDNVFLAAVLQLIYKLVSFGYYVSPNDIEKLRVPLIDMIDGRGDLDRPRKGKELHDPRLEKWRTTERFDVSGNTTVVVKCRDTAIRILGMILNLVIEAQLQDLLLDFKCLHTNQIKAGSKALASRESVLTKIRKTSADDTKTLFKLSDRVREYTVELTEETNWISPKWHPYESEKSHLVDVLLDDAQYKYNSLLGSSMSLLHRLFSARHDLFSYAVRTRIVKTQESKDLMEYLAANVPTLRRLCRGFLEKDEIEPYLSIVSHLERKCYTPRVNASLDCDFREDPPHKVNQQLILNADILPVLLSVLRKNGQTAEVLNATFYLLRGLAVDNEPMQEALYENFSLLLSQTKSDGWQDAFGFCLAEAFTGNHKLCLSITADEIGKVMKILQEKTVAVPHILALLESVLKAEKLGLPLKRNQDMVVKFLLESRQTVIDPAYIDDESSEAYNQQRLELLRGNSSADGSKRGSVVQLQSASSDHLLQTYHCNLVKLLASCAEGENKYIESMCQTIFSIPEILDVLQDGFIDVLVKGPYLQFFLWVYLNTANPSDEVIDAKIGENEVLWSSLEAMAESDIFKKDNLSPLELEFGLQSFVPLVTVLVKSHYNDSSCAAAKSCVRALARSLSKFAALVAEVVDDHVLVKKAILSVISLASVAPGELNQATLEKLTHSLAEQDAEGSSIECIELYNQYYKEEIELNEAFDDFSTKLQQIYAGQNTLQRQLHPHGTSKFENPNQKYADEPGGKNPLPLYPEFQRQLHLFCEFGERDGVKVPVALKPAHESLIRVLGFALCDGEEDEDEMALTAPELLELNIRTMQVLRAILHNVVVVDQDPSHLQLGYQDAIEPLFNIVPSRFPREAHAAFVLINQIMLGGNAQAQARALEFFESTHFEEFFENLEARIQASIESMVELRALKTHVIEEMKNSDELVGTMTLVNQLGGPSDATSQSTGSVAETAFDEKRQKRQEMHRKKILDQLEVKDEGHIEILMEIVQNMCEGYNIPMKNYFRFQADNIKSANLVSNICALFKRAIEQILPATIDLVIQCAETLVELCQGCVGNQQDVLDEHIIDDINDILRAPGFDVDEYQVAHLKHGCVKLILSLLENSDAHTRVVAQEITEKLDLKCILAEMNAFYETHRREADARWYDDAEDVEEEDRVTALEISFAFYHIVHRLTALTGKDIFGDPENYVDPLLNRKGRVDPGRAHTEFTRRGCLVEILRDNELHSVLFYNNYFNELRDSDKDGIIWNVDRSSPADKLRDFTTMSRTVIADFKYVLSLKRSSFILRFLVKLDWFWRTMMLLFTGILNGIILFAWSADSDASEPLPVVSNWFNRWFEPLAYVDLCFAALVTISYFLLNPTSIHKTVEGIPVFGERLVLLLPQRTTLRTKRSLLAPFAIHHLLLVPSVVLALLYKGYFIFYPLFHIVVGNDILQRVLQAVTKNGSSLLWIALLLVFVIYAYAFLSFAYFREYSDSASGYWCDSIWGCLVTSTLYGLRDGGVFSDEEGSSFTRFVGKSAFDITFFIIINTIGLNVVFGVIVDAFAALRDEKYQIEEAMSAECFICNRRSYDIERFGSGFHHHIKHEHNMWHYVYFLLYLAEKRREDYTSHEFYVQDSIDHDEELQVFPIGRALCLENHEEDEEDHIEQLEQRINQLDEKLDFLINTVVEGKASGSLP